MDFENDLDRDLERIILGTTLDEFLPKIPTAEQTIRQLSEFLLTQYPELILHLGYSESEGEVEISEEERLNCHIIGAPRQGKSKLLELFTRHDIDHTIGATIFDCSENGENAYKILKYACKQGYEKVIFINPPDILKSGRVPCLNPFGKMREGKYVVPPSTTASNLAGMFRTTWGQQTFHTTPRIKKYMPAIMKALHYAGCTLSEAKYFFDRSPSRQRESMLDSMPGYETARKILLTALTDKREFQEGFVPTVNQLMPLDHPVMEVLLGSVTGLSFTRLIKENYLVVINMDLSGVWDEDQRALLGTIILTMLQKSVSRLRYRDDGTIKHRVYLDEAFLFATKQFADSLYLKLKTGVTFTFAHHSFSQFEPSIASAIRATSDLKFMFHVDDDDRRIMLKSLGYGGALSDRDVVYNLRAIPKRSAAFRTGKKDPFVLRIRDIEDAEVDSKVFASYLENIYAQDFYRSVTEVREEINNRFVYQRANPEPGGASVGKTRRNPKSDTKEPTRNDSVTTVQSVPVDDPPRDGGNGSVDVRSPEETRPVKRKASLLPPKLHKHKQDSE